MTVHTFRQRPARTVAELVADAHAAALRLSTTMRSWPTETPSSAAIDEAANAIEGLRLTLCELRPHTTRPPHAA